MLWYLEELVSISKMPGWVGWEGKGCHGMGVGLGAMWKKLEKISVFYPQIIPSHDCGALLASAGQLVAPLKLLFALLVITWEVLVPASVKYPKEIRKSNGNLSQN